MIIDRGRVIAQGTPSELKRLAGRDVAEVRARQPEDLSRSWVHCRRSASRGSTNPPIE